MVIDGIDTKDISVVVQGAVDSINTPVCLASIRKYLPEAEIILSTWDGADVSKLDHDVLVMSKDPGGPLIDNVFQVRNNVNRQIISTKNGLKKSSRLYAIKIRSDMCFCGTQFLKVFGLFHQRNNTCRLLKQRVVINNLYCANPWKTNFCFHVSDWFFFGLRQDILNIFEIELQADEENMNWFSPFNRPKLDPVPTWNFRYIPEQYIWTSFLRKNGEKFKFDFFSDVTSFNIMLTELSFANNLIILDYENSGIKFLKFNPYKFDYTKQYSLNDWLGLFRKYCLYNDVDEIFRADSAHIQCVLMGGVLPNISYMHKSRCYRVLKIILSPMRPLVRLFLKRPLRLLRRFWNWCG